MTSRVLYLDLVGGAAGDMLLAALIDAGAPLEAVRAAVASLGLHDVELVVRNAFPAGLHARQVDVMVRGQLGDSGPAGAEQADHLVVPPTGAHAGAHSHPHGPGAGDEVVIDAASSQAASHGLGAHARTHGSDAASHSSGERDHAHSVDHAHAHAHSLDHDRSFDHDHDHAHQHARHRPYAEIRSLISGAALGARTREIALQTFAHLAEAEGKAHGIPVEDVVFHEVGADDALADIVGVAAAIEALAPTEIVVSPVPMGRGLTKGAHGPIPLPSPATLQLLLGAPLLETALVGETVTPTGAALLRTLATRFGPAPSMTLERVGVGAGHRAWPDRPNVVRALVGTKIDSSANRTAEDCVVEANIDDMSPEHFGALERALFEAGAMDVWSTPVRMKKGRLGQQISALVRRTLEPVVTEAFFAHSTTLGVRSHDVARTRVERRTVEVQTSYGMVRVKVSERAVGPALAAPEHDDCDRLAQAAKAPLRAVYEAALRAYWNAHSAS